MKGFSAWMDRAGDSPHVLKLGMIFIATAMAALIGAIIGLIFSKTAGMWMAGILASLVLLKCLANYRNFWEFAGPSLEGERVPAPPRYSIPRTPVPVRVRK